MSVRVAYPCPQSPAVLDALEAQLGSGLVLERGPSARGRAHILIDGRPSAEDLVGADLHSVVVPFAGVPAATVTAVRSVPGVTLHNLHHNAPETAETALALLLAAARDVIPMDRSLRAHDWTPRYAPSRTLRLAGRRALILGYGAIGRRVAAACLALGMHVSAVRREVTAAEDGVAQHAVGDLDTLLPSADALIVALPHTSETDGLIDARRVGLLPQDAIVVNVARAAIIDERALFEALKQGRLHSAGLDVWYCYPQAAAGAVPGYFEAPATASCTPPSLFPFHTLDNVVMSPHRGGTSRDTERFRVEALAQLLAPAALGLPLGNRVDLDRGY